MLTFDEIDSAKLPCDCWGDILTVLKCEFEGELRQTGDKEGEMSIVGVEFWIGKSAIKWSGIDKFFDLNPHHII